MMLAILKTASERAVARHRVVRNACARACSVRNASVGCIRFDRAHRVIMAPDCGTPLRAHSPGKIRNRREAAQSGEPLFSRGSRRVLLADFAEARAPRSCGRDVAQRRVTRGGSGLSKRDQRAHDARCAQRRLSRSEARHRVRASLGMTRASEGEGKLQRRLTKSCGKNPGCRSACCRSARWIRNADCTLPEQPAVYRALSALAGRHRVDLLRIGSRAR